MPLSRAALPFSFALVGLMNAGPIRASELKPVTAKAFAHYEALTEARMQSEVDDPGGFLLLDTLPEGQKAEEIARVRGGQIYIQPLSTKDNGKKIEIPDGMVHHWIAVGFLPKAHLADAMRVAQDYEHHADFFGPDIQRSHLLNREGEHFRIAYRFYKHTIVTVTYNTEFEAEFTLRGPTQAYSSSKAVRIAEVRNAGEKNEREYPVGNDHGFLWRLNLYARYLEVEDGLFIQVELLSLSRTVPALLAWLVNPYLRSIPRDYLSNYIRRFGKTVNQQSKEQPAATKTPARTEP
jgi:hypothetical protein